MSQNNQFPGQNPQQGGGQQFPQQGGQQYGQPQGGQQYGQPQGGQQYGQPQGGQQYGQPQGGQQYGQPQGQQGGYAPAGQYGQQPGQFGRPPGGPGGPGGFQSPPNKPKSNGMVIGIVLAGLAAVGLLGWLLMTVFGGGQGPDVPTPSPSPVTSSTVPSPSPSTPTATPTETEEPSPSPTTSTNPSGDSVEVGLGTSVTPASGWEQSNRNELKNYTELSNGRAVLATQAFRVEGGVTGKQIVDSYMKQVTANMTGVQTKPAAELDVKNSRLSAGIASWTGTRATSQGSVKLTYVSIISVRDDGLAVMSTLIVPSGVTVASVQEDYLSMTNSLLNSQLKA